MKEGSSDRRRRCRCGGVRGRGVAECRGVPHHSPVMSGAGDSGDEQLSTVQGGVGVWPVGHWVGCLGHWEWLRVSSPPWQLPAPTIHYQHSG